MKRASYRPEQVAETVRHVLADALAREVRDPRLRRVTVTRVQVSADLAHARVLVVVGGDPSQRDRALAGLQSAAGFLRSRVAQALPIRTAPELRFEVDRGVEHAHQIDALLAALRRGEEV